MFFSLTKEGLSIYTGDVPDIIKTGFRFLCKYSLTSSRRTSRSVMQSNSCSTSVQL
jgi:hypothetical protein